MGIGIGIFLIALGAILTFAVDWNIAGLDLAIVGWILMIVGVGGLIMFFTFWNRRREPEAVTAMKQRSVTEQPRTLDRSAPPTPAKPATPPAPPTSAPPATPPTPPASTTPATVTTVTPPQPPALTKH